MFPICICVIWPVPWRPMETKPGTPAVHVTRRKPLRLWRPPAFSVVMPSSGRRPRPGGPTTFPAEAARHCRHCARRTSLPDGPEQRPSSGGWGSNTSRYRRPPPIARSTSTSSWHRRLAPGFQRPMPPVSHLARQIGEPKPLSQFIARKKGRRVGHSSGDRPLNHLMPEF